MAGRKHTQQSDLIRPDEDGCSINKSCSGNVSFLRLTADITGIRAHSLHGRSANEVASLVGGNGLKTQVVRDNLCRESDTARHRTTQADTHGRRGKTREWRMKRLVYHPWCWQILLMCDRKPNNHQSRRCRGSWTVKSFTCEGLNTLEYLAPVKVSAHTRTPTWIGPQLKWGYSSENEQLWGFTKLTRGNSVAHPLCVECVDAEFMLPFDCGVGVFLCMRGGLGNPGM